MVYGAGGGIYEAWIDKVNRASGFKFWHATFLRKQVSSGEKIRPSE
ncbi:hypothetical protein [Klebsiella pasteurii]